MSCKDVKMPKIPQESKKKNPWIFVVIGIVIVFVVGVGVVSSFFVNKNMVYGRSETELIEQTVDCFEEMNVKEFVDLYPKGILEYELEQSGYSEEQMIKMYMGYDFSELVSLMDDVDLDCEVVSESKLSNEDYKRVKNFHSKRGIEIEDAKILSVKVHFSILGHDGTQVIDVSVVKVDSSWYLDASSVY